MKRLNDIIDDNNSNSGLKIQKLEDGNKNNETLSIRDACDIALLWTSAKVSIGEKLFVRWIISIESNKSSGNEDDVDEDVFWWPCKVCFNDNIERDSKGRRIWYLEYDEIKGFKSDKCKVIFENNERIKHIDYENISLRFLRESDNQELRKKIDIEEDEEFRDSKIEDIEISLEEILKAEDQYVDSNGDNSSESNNLMNLFNLLPHEKKISLALGYRQFADKFLEFLHKKIGKNSNNTTIITNLDIQEFIRNLGLEDHLNNKDKFKLP
ncbi:hypothetical protein cand_002020 [Cryptosporidium andersoni]|uniref:Uncharacterized protein n=1 Tax=Cryptosporidium andersoni TaxID=117008 RepID=A0A1J4MQB0_9CRYT|nr:hypothetical protein cand_002020 [Cryptosporidium andersoni]